MIAVNIRQRVLRILAFCAAMLPGLAWPAVSFECNGEAAMNFAGSQNDLSPTSACVLKLTADNSSLSVTGLSGGVPGRILVIENGGSTNSFTLADASTSSSVGNRFQFPANITLAPSAAVLLRYDAGTREWKAVASVASEDITVADDLTVTDDLAVTGLATVGETLTVTGNVLSVGGFTSPLTLSASKARIYHGTKALTLAGGAEAIFTLTTATTQASGGTLTYRITATDTTDYAVRFGTVNFTCNNLAGTVTSSVSHADETVDLIETTNAKTLTYAITDSNAANTCVINFNIDSDMTVSAASMEWFLVLLGPGTIS